MSTGLRERKKLATREALAKAALRLVLERGLERVRVEDIAAEVGVSPRTFNNYFSSKEQAIVSIAVDRAAETCAALRARPSGEPLADALSHALVSDEFGDIRRGPESVTRLRLVLSSPALRGEYLKAIVATERPLADAIAERLGAGVADDLYPRVVAAAATSAVRVAIAHWVTSGTSATLPALIRQAVRQVVCEGGTRT
jgi:AcrR family transcriptional regulator